MPLRDFTCQTCDKTTEHLVNTNEPDPAECECGGELERVETPPTGTGLAFGPGFFKTGGY